MSSKRWCFTLNHHTSDDETYLQQVECLYLVYGREVAESGTPHLQGFFTFKKMQRLSGVKKLLPRAHFEVAKGTSVQASDYCKKDGDFFEKGEPPTQGKRSDLEEYCNRIKKGENVVAISIDLSVCYVRHSRGLRDFALLSQKPYTHHDVRGKWIYGPPGSGKTRSVHWDYPSLFIKGQNKWFDGYAGEKAILIDDFDKQGTCLSHYLKIWADRYPCSGETKGGMLHLHHEHLIITSNYEIVDLFPDDSVLCEALTRRFEIVFMDI